MRELDDKEKVSLFTFMLKECDTLKDHVCEFGNFDDATAECSLRHVLMDRGSNGQFVTVVIFWNEGNDCISVFQGERQDNGRIRWRLTCDQECN